jgi:pimeloyl-ACP methyl ester carboxylesterase
MIELPLPPGVERRRLETSHGPINALHAPASGPAAVMVSGCFGTKEDFRALLPLLAAQDYDAWAYDYPGQLDQIGQLDCPGLLNAERFRDETRFTIPHLAEQLNDIVTSVSPRAPVHMVGHCLGGFVAREAVLKVPDIARSLTLLACGPSMREPKHQRMLSGLSGMVDNGGTIVLWPLVKRLLAQDDTIMREFWHTKLATMNPCFVTGAGRSMGEVPDRSTELKDFQTLVVHGKRDKRLWTHHAYAEMARVMGARLVVIERAAHSPNMEQPAPTAQALLEFWGQP